MKTCEHCGGPLLGQEQWDLLCGWCADELEVERGERAQAEED